MKMKKLSKRQQAILDFIREFIIENSYPPSVREIGKSVGLNSSSTVHAHLRNLETMGYIKRNPAISRAIELIETNDTPLKEAGVTQLDEYREQRLVEVPLLGRVTAGLPLEAVENVEDVYALPFSLVGSEDVFMLKIVGDSMIEAGIHNGDLAIVRKQDHASNGDIVVALTEDNEATTKRYYKEDGRYRLQPENPVMDPIYVDRLTICGKVVGIYRAIY